MKREIDIEYIKKCFNEFVIPNTNIIQIKTNKEFFDSIIDVYYNQYKERIK